jgi:D-alanine-D-alanine ligase
VSGRDVTVSVMGNGTPRAFRPWQLRLRNGNHFATERIKFSAKTRRKSGIRAVRYSGRLDSELRSTAVRLYKALDLSGYARLDFRVNETGQAYFIDANANPNLARDEDFACSARLAGLNYEDLIREILKLAVSYGPRV